MRRIPLFAASVVTASALVCSHVGALTFVNVVDSHTTSPVTFNSFNGLNTAESGGTVAFRGGYSGGIGVFTGNGTTITQIAKPGDPATAGTSFGTFNNTFGFSPAVSGSTVVFTAVYGNNNIGFFNTGIFSGNGGAAAAVVLPGNATPSGGTFSGVGDPVISGNTIAFDGGDKNATGTTSGIFTTTGGVISTIAKAGDPAPVGVFSSNLGNGPAISGNTVGFNPYFNSFASQGIVTVTGGVVTSVAKTGDTSTPGHTFGESFSPVSLSGKTAAFYGYDDADTNGIYTGNGGALTNIANIGDVAPGTGGDQYEIFDPPSISGSLVAFHSTYTDGQGNYGDGIFVSNSNGGGVTPLILGGDPLFGDTVAISSDALSFDSLSADIDGGQIVSFTYTLANGTTGIAEVTVPVPEPASLSGLALAAAVLVRRRRA